MLPEWEQIRGGCTLGELGQACLLFIYLRSSGQARSSGSVKRSNRSSGSSGPSRSSGSSGWVKPSGSSGPSAAGELGRAALAGPTSPRHATPRLAPPRPASPRLASPRPASPRPASPRPATSRPRPGHAPREKMDTKKPSRIKGRVKGAKGINLSLPRWLWSGHCRAD